MYGRRSPGLGGLLADVGGPWLIQAVLLSVNIRGALADVGPSFRYRRRALIDTGGPLYGTVGLLPGLGSPPADIGGSLGHIGGPLADKRGPWLSHDVIWYMYTENSWADIGGSLVDIAGPIAYMGDPMA